jgi:hypothetical protein
MLLGKQLRCSSEQQQQQQQQSQQQQSQQQQSQKQESEQEGKPANKVIDTKKRKRDAVEKQPVQPQAHDSVEDALASLALVQHELQRLARGEGPTPLLQPPEIKVDKDEQAKLCVHRLPAGAVGEDVRTALAGECRAAGSDKAADLAAAARIEVEGGVRGQLMMLAFSHPGHASDVFNALPGEPFASHMIEPSAAMLYRAPRLHKLGSR